MNLLLVYPEFPFTFWSLKYAVRFAFRKALLPPLGLLTVAGLLPRDWDIRLIDLNVSSLTDDDLQWADYVLISAMLVQKDSVQAIAAKCARLAKPVVLGGPITTGLNAPLDNINCIVKGEAEQIIESLLEDMLTRNLKPLYQAQAFPDIRTSPIPRWDLIRLNDYSTMAVQFSRGCPFDCEFCDITVLNGRLPRTKTPQQLIAELDMLLQYGWDGPVFIVDDNFIGNKRQVKELLKELIKWRKERSCGITFLTEASLNLADDDEMLEMMIEAGFKRVFVGIETPLLQSLKECGKVQNLRRDLLSSVQKLQQAGLEVMAGFIVGFDNDPPDIFDRQFEFIQASGIATAMVGLLTALPNTRLYHRLLKEGRLIREASGNNTEASLNFIPRLDTQFLINGYKQLMRKLYDPVNFYSRIAKFVERFRVRGPSSKIKFEDILAFFKVIWVLGVLDKGRKEFWKLLIKCLKYPATVVQVVSQAAMGYHYRKVAEAL